MKILAFLVGFALLLPLVSATPLEYMESVVDLGESNSNFTFVFLFKEAPEGNLEYFLPFSIDNFDDSANFRNYTCNAYDKGGSTRLFCDFSLVEGGGRALSMRFNTPETLTETDNKIVFNVDIKTPQDIERMVVKAVLKKGYILIEEPEGSTNLVPYSPKDGTEGSDGRRIFVEWEKEDIKKGEGLDILVVYERIGTVPETDQNIVFLLIGILILVIAIILGLGSGKKETVDMSILKGNEKRVMDIIKEMGGMCKQRHVVRETDFSKAKVSRLVKDLEERGLIETEKSGRSKKIYIKKKESKI